MVKRIISTSFLGIHLLLTSCGGSSDHSKESIGNGANHENNQPHLAFGIYADTLPCMDCPGVYTELTILPDTTYSLSEWQMSESGRPTNSKLDRGIYSFTEGGKIKLTSRKEGNPERLMMAGDRALTLEPNGNTPSQGDFSLEMKEDWKASMEGANVFYKLSPFNGHPTMVFNSLKGNEIHIAKKYLEIASQAELAIVSYYAIKFSTGCDADKCALIEALAMDIQEIQNLIGKWLPTEGNLARSSSDHLLSLFILQNGNDFQVNYSFSDADNNVINGNDVFKLNSDRFDVIHNATNKRAGQKSKASSGGSTKQ
jgi:hypothetical protein